MKIPAITGIIKRRVLVNYRVHPEIAHAVLPPPFRPKTHDGYAIAGICLIRLEEIRPKGLPSFAGVWSENCAHRIAVQWEDATGAPKEGVFIPRRDTNSRINSIAGGRIFPGVHHLSTFTVNDHWKRICVRVAAPDFSSPLVDVAFEEADHFTPGSAFASLEESSRFLESGCLGYSSRDDSCTLDGLSLKVPDWKVSPLNAIYVRSAYFDDRSIFPPGSITFDHALLMRDTAHEWHSEPQLDSAEKSEPPVAQN